MDTVRTLSGARGRRQLDREAGRRVALVPTMGALHEGHLSLVRHAASRGDSVWVSVFVNPTQFGPGEDYERYPRDLAGDAGLLEAGGADVLFAPSAEEMYPRAPVAQIAFSGLESVLCGASRPGHFGGVGLVVAKLLNIVQPDVAIFGQKDAQQALLIRRLVDDLSFPVEVVVSPTVREADGLAMSSRNAYLTQEQRRAAPALHRALQLGAAMVRDGETDARRVEEAMAETVSGSPLLQLEYARCVDADDLSRPETIGRPVLLALAVRAGDTRLIDNVLVSPGGE